MSGKMTVSVVKKLECRHFASDHFWRPEVGAERATMKPVLCLAISSINHFA